jgi:hypothetical protein
MLQQDTWLKETCRPKNAILLLNQSCQHWYADIKEKFVFYHLELRLSKRQLSVIYAIAFAKCCEVSKFILYAFDAATIKDTSYAKSIGYSPLKGGSPVRFLEHRKIIEKHAGKIPLEFYIKNPAGVLNENPSVVLPDESRDTTLVAAGI